MQFQRVMLWVALGLTLVMIWQSWVEFQNDKLQVQQGRVIQQSSDNTASNISEDVPDAPEVTTPATSESDVIEEVGQIEQLAEGGKLISIKTDLIHAEIDTLGGDLVRVELLKHPVSVDTPDIPFVLMSRELNDLFVAQNGIIGTDREYPNHNVQFSTTQYEYDLGDDEQMDIVLKWTAPDGVKYEKIFHFVRDSYRIEIEFKVNNTTATPWTGFAYGQLKQTERATAGSMGIIGQLPSYNGAAIYTDEGKYEKVDYGDIRDEALNVTTSEGWVAMLQHYFVAAWLPIGSDNYQFYTGVSDHIKPQYRVGYKTT